MFRTEDHEETIDDIVTLTDDIRNEASSLVDAECPGDIVAMLDNMTLAIKTLKQQCELFRKTMLNTDEE